MKIENIKIKKESFPTKSCGIGDLIAIFYALENIGFQKSILFKLNTNLDVSFFKYFNFKNILITNNEGEDLIKSIDRFSKVYCCCKKNLGHFNGTFFIVAMLNFFKKEYGYEPLFSFPISVNLVTSLEQKRIAVQFDSRSKKQKRILKDYFIKKILKKENDFFCLGGIETQRYLGEEIEYQLGDMKFVIQKLKNSKKFIGTDSGMSHCAGMIGIKSEIYLKDFCGCLSQYYLESYRDFKIFNANFRIF